MATTQRPRTAGATSVALAFAFVLGSLLALGTGQAVIDPSVTPGELAASIATAALPIAGASFVTVPGGTPTGIDDAPLSDFPRDGPTFALLSTGNAQHARNPNNSGSTSTGNGGGHVNGGSTYDVVILRVDVAVPTGVDCLTFDFQFFSEEYPEYVGSQFNDAFLAELEVSDWSVSGSSIDAPHNFAFDENGSPITVNQASMSAANAAGTTYDGATDVLRATTPVTAGEHAVYFTIFDLGDDAYDSTVFLDRLVVGTAGESGCEPGAAPPDLDPPAPPGSLVAAVLAVDSVGLAWDAPANDGGSPITAYRVYRAGSDGAFSLVGETAPATLDHTDVVGACTTYTYRVTAVNDEGESPPSNEAEASTPCAPGAPLLSAVAGPGAAEITLSWTAVAGDVSEYRVYEVAGETTTPIGSVPGDVLSFVHDAGGCITRTYAVTAVNAVGEGPASNLAGAATLCPPDQPASLAVSLASAQAVSLTWEPPLGGDPIDGYRVYRLGEEDDTLKGDVPATTLDFLDTLGTCATGSYYVVAYNAAGESAPSTIVTLSTTCPPGVPVDLAALAGPGLGQLSIAWGAPLDGDAVTGYELRAGAPGEPKETIATVDATTTSATEAGLGPGVARCYQVVALNGAGASAASNEDCATTFAAPSFPLDLVVEADIAAVALAWASPADDGGRPVLYYEVTRSDATHDAELLGTTAETTWLDEVASCSAFTYAVRGVNEVGPGASASADTMTPCPPGAPLDLSGVAGVRSAHLAWSAPFSDGGRPIEGYLVYRSEAGAERGPIATLPPEAFSFDDVLPDCTGFVYEIVPFNAVGPGDASATSLMTPCVPDAPTALRAERGPGLGQLTVTWEGPAEQGPLGYRLYSGATLDELSLLRELDGEAPGFLDEGLGSGTERCYGVAAVNEVGEGPRSEPGADDCARTFGAPDAPGLLSARSGPGFGEVSLEWAAPADDGGRPIEAYFLYRAGSPDHQHFLTTLGPETTDYVDDELDDGAHFYYTVTAGNDAGESAPSNMAHGASYTRQAESAPEPLPAGVAETGAVWQGEFAFVFGGVQGDEERTSTNAITRFDPDTGETETVNLTLPTPRHDFPALWIPASEGNTQSCHPACAFGGIGYLFGGDWTEGTAVGAPQSCHPACFAGTDILRFVPDEGSIEKIVTELPESLAGAAGAVVPQDTNVGFIQSCHPACMAGLGYLFGGERSKLDAHVHGAVPESCHPACAAGFDDEILQFDPGTEGLALMSARLPTPRTQMSAVYGNGYVYLFGGMDATGDLAEILRYDPAADVVETLGVELPSPRQGTSAFWDGAAAYVIGGSANGTRLSEIVRFDPADAEVQPAGELPSGRDGTSVVYDGTTAHIFGGDDGNETLDEVVQFTPTAPQNPDAEPQPHDAAPAGGLTRGQASSGAGRILVHWDAPASAGLAPLTSYNVYRATAPDDEALYATVSASQTTFLDVGLPRATTFYYKISAVSSVGEGPQSDEVNATTTDLPGAPRELRALPGGVGVVSLAWQVPTSDGGEALRVYRVYRSTSGLGSGIALVGEVDAASTTFQDGGCRLGTFCTYVVAAVNVHGQGPLSNAASAAGTKV